MTDIVCGIEVGSKMYLYCEARLLGMNANQASKAAGYTSNTNLEANPKVKAYLSAQRGAMRKVSMISREDVLVGFHEAIQDAKLLSDPQSQISGWREIGRMLGYYEPETKRLVLTTEQQVTKDQLEDMAEDELLRLASDGYDIADAEFDFIPAEPQTNH